MKNFQQVALHKFPSGDTIIATFPERLSQISVMTCITPLRIQSDASGKLDFAFLKLPSGRICALTDFASLAEAGKPRTNLAFDKGDVARHGVETLLKETLAALAAPTLTPSWIGEKTVEDDARTVLKLPQAPQGPVVS